MRFQRPRPLTTRPSVSVVVPCYNYGHFLPDAVSSALDQDGVDVDVLIVDDASPDGSAEVARSLADQDSRVRVLAHERNRGHIATYNHGLMKATGDYVVLLSADDLLMPGALGRAAALMEARPDIVLTYGYAADFEDAAPARGSDLLWWTTWTGEEWLARVCGRGRNLIINPEAMLRTAVMHELAGYRSEHPHSADMEVWMRAAVRGGVGRVNGPTQAGYRVHGTNMHVTTFGGVLTDLRAVRAVFDSFFGASGDGAVLPDAHRLHVRAARALAREAVLATARPHLAARDRRALASFAREVRPDVSRSLAWVVRGPESAAPHGLRAAVLQRIESARWIVRWQRWQKLGT